ncbi:MAG: sensor histidine kinase [Arthrospira sp. SH-MAG29]|nr:sensor histidine kinase [Arthrospira sp. SH-MAG29]MBS0017058.1 sensor histidine kinase [Arthrospira sp. SH-MAG29]
MKNIFGRSSFPVPLLLYLEWVLLAIALLTAFSPLPYTQSPGGEGYRVHRQIHRPDRPEAVTDHRPERSPYPDRPQNRHRRHYRSRRFPLGILVSIGSLGVMGLRLPERSRRPAIRWVYIACGFTFSWLAVIFGGRGVSFFSALLLVVVIRACLLFSWRGRIAVAIFAYGLFLLWVFLRLRPLADNWADPIQGLVLTLTFNSSVLFGLVLLFILLLVGALLSEQESHQKLAEANQKLREYAMLIEDRAISQERNRIAREIHDSVGHNLTAQSIQLENVALFLAEDKQRAARHLEQARELGKEALKEVRASVRAWRSHPLKQSFGQALSQLISEFEATTSVPVASNLQIGDTLPIDISIVLYRVIQEAFTNISKHAKATKVQLIISENSREFYLKIEDDGCGFNPGQNTTGFGLQGMGERLMAVGGHFSLNSSPGEGCKIEVKIGKNQDDDSSSIG